MDAVHDLGIGIYFAPQDYAGFLRRLTIVAVDFLAIMIVGIFILFVWAVTTPVEQGSVPLFVWLGLAYIYLTLLRGSRLRTLGYILTGVKIVNLKGDRPSFFWMNLRLVLWVMGPINPIFDLVWFWGDEKRQTLRDKLAGTYVVRRRAIPVGEGPIGVTTLFVLGYTLFYPEVKMTSRRKG